MATIVGADQMQVRQNSKAFCNSLVAFIPALRKFAWRLCPNKSDIDDLVQETLYNALRGERLYDRALELGSWLFTIMRNAAVTAFRRNSRDARYLQRQALDDLIVAPNQEWAVLHRQVSDEMNKLSPVKKQAIIQISIAPNYQVAADMCECDIGTLKTRVRRARQELAVRFSDCMIPDDSVAILHPRLQ